MLLMRYFAFLLHLPSLNIFFSIRLLFTDLMILPPQLENRSYATECTYHFISYSYILARFIYVDFGIANPMSFKIVFSEYFIVRKLIQNRA